MRSNFEKEYDVHRDATNHGLSLEPPECRDCCAFR